MSTLIAALSFGQRQRGLRAQTDVQLARAFAELVPIANARGPGELSDTAAGKLADREYPNPAALEAALQAAVITSPVGATTQVAVMRAIATLGCEHPILWPAAKAAVEVVELNPEWDSQKKDALKELGDRPPKHWGRMFKL